DDTLAPPESLLIAALRESSPDVINDPYALYGAQRIVVEYRPCTQPPSHNSKHACIASNATTASLLLCSAPSSVWPYWARPGAAATSSLPMKSARSASSSSTTEATLSINGRSTAACLSRSSDRWQCVAASILYPMRCHSVGCGTPSQMHQGRPRGGRRREKFQRAVSIPRDSGLSSERVPNRDCSNIYLADGFCLRVQPFSRCKGRKAGLRKFPRHGVERPVSRARNSAHSTNGGKAHCQDAMGAIFKIEFTDLKSRAPEEHEVAPTRYYIVTDDRIILLNACPNHSSVLTPGEIEEDNDCAVKKISALDKPPEFDPGDVYGITTGKFSHGEEGGLWHKTISVKGDLCINLDEHPSGHFTKIVWKKGVSLVEFAMGYGAAREGFASSAVYQKSCE